MLLIGRKTQVPLNGKKKWYPPGTLYAGGRKECRRRYETLKITAPTVKETERKKGASTARGDRIAPKQQLRPRNRLSRRRVKKGERRRKRRLRMVGGPLARGTQG